MKLAGKQVAAARELLGLSQTDLATMAGIARPSISKFEAGRGELRLATLTKIQDELERRGIEFINGRGMGVRLNYDKAAEFARTPTPARGESDR